jgi:hypothetical protein
MDKATMGTRLEMIRVVKFVFDTKTFCLKIRPENEIKNWSFHVFCDSDRKGESDLRISIIGFIVYLINVPICWRSKTQRGVTLHSRKAEYRNFRSGKVDQVKLFLLGEIGIGGNLLITVKTDNIGAIFWRKTPRLA